MPPGRRPIAEEGIEERRFRNRGMSAQPMSALEAYARAQGLTLAGPVNPANIPQMTEAAGPIKQPAPAGFWDNVKGLGGGIADTVLAFVPGTQQSYDMSAAIQEDPLMVVKAPVQSASRVVDLLPYVDTGEEGIDYINAYNRGEGLNMGFNDALTLFTLGRGAVKAGTPIVRQYVTNPGARFNPYEYGIHVNVPGEAGNIKSIVPRQVGQATTVGGDSAPGYSYMWDATSPRINQIFDNSQMTNLDDMGNKIFMYDNDPQGFFTRVLKGKTRTDVNIPLSDSLAVKGSQKVLEQFPFSTESLQELLARRRVMQMSPDTADAKMLLNSAKSNVPEAIINSDRQMAINTMRDNITRAQGYPDNPYSKYNPNMSVVEMVKDPYLSSAIDAYVDKRMMSHLMSGGDFIRDEVLSILSPAEYKQVVAETIKLSKATGKPVIDVFEELSTKAVDAKIAKYPERYPEYEGNVIDETPPFDAFTPPNE